MSVKEKSDLRSPGAELVEGPADTCRPMIHIYPRDPSYRLSGNVTQPQPGDIACCGWRKRSPFDPSHLYLPTECVVCAEFKWLAGL